MPIYEYFCAKCHRNQDAFRSMVARDRAPACKKCGRDMKLIDISVPTPSNSDRLNVRDPFKKV